MAARLYLLRPNDPGPERPLTLIVSRGRRRIGVPAGVSVRPADWLQASQRVRSTTPGATDLNAALAELRADAAALALRYPDDAELRAALLKRVGRAPQKVEPLLLELYDEFLEYRRSRVKENTVKVFEALKAHLEAFIGNKRLTASHINSGFLADFQTFLLTEAGLQNNSVNKYASRCRTFLLWAHERGHLAEVPKAKPLTTAQNHVVRLSLPELAALRSVDLSREQPGYEAVREIFLFACYTGQRFGDCMAMTWSDVRGNAWYLAEQKTNVTRRIPLPTPALQIIERHRGERRPLPKLSNQKANEFIKVVAKLAGIKEPVTIREQKGGSLESKTLPKCDVLTMHDARRTFISLMMEAGLSTKEMLGITHSDLRSLKQYAGASEAHLKRTMESVFGSTTTRTA